MEALCFKLSAPEKSIAGFLKGRTVSSCQPGEDLFYQPLNWVIHVHRNQMVPKTEGKKTTTEKKALFSCKCSYLISMFQRGIEAKRWQMLRRCWLKKASRSSSKIVASPRSVAVVSCNNYTKQKRKATFLSQEIKVGNIFANGHTKIEKNLGGMI